MSNTTDDNSSIFCSPFNTWPYYQVAIVRASAGGVSFLACLAVIVMMLSFRKHLLFKQRLIFYLNVAAMINAFFIVIQGANYFPNTTSKYFEIYCTVIGFCDQTSQTSLFVAIGCITTDLFFTSALHKEYKLEKLYITLIFVLPLLVNWVPFVFEGYWSAGPWCWITKYERNNCSETDFAPLMLTFILWYIPAYVMLAVTLLVYIIIVVSIKRQKYKYSGVYAPNAEHQRRSMEKEVKLLIWYPLIFLIINIFPFINRVCETLCNGEVFELWMMHALFSPLQGGFIALVYAFDKETLRRLWKLMRNKWIFCHFMSENQVTVYNVHVGPSDSYDGSSSELPRSKETEKLVH